MNKYLKALPFLIILLAQVEPAFASIFKKLVRAKEMTEIEALERRVALEREYEIACAWELQEGQVPSHCFLVNFDNKKAIGDLLRKCKGRAVISQDIELLKKKSQVEGVPAKCSGQIERQIQVLLYQAQPVPDNF